MGKTYSKQSSSNTNWDLVGRELATLDELAKIKKGNCILFLATIGAFYSKLYNLKEHPNYKLLYEPWLKNTDKLYDHKKELESQEKSNYKLLCDLGLPFAKIVEDLQIEEVDEEEVKKLLETGVMQFDDLKN